MLDSKSMIRLFGFYGKVYIFPLLSIRMSIKVILEWGHKSKRGHVTLEFDHQS